MKPFIISHMMMSVDGRIDCAMTEKIEEPSVYYDALDSLACPSLLMGRVTMQLHYASGQWTAGGNTAPVGHECFHVASGSEGYTIALDTHGSLAYSGNTADGKPLLVVVAECCPKAYLDYLAGKGISWVAAGKEHIDLRRAMELVADHFGVRRISLVGGGHVNGAFLAAGLLDEVSVMVGPGIDGRRGMTAIFDGIADPQAEPVLLDFRDVKRVGNDTVWLRYTVRQ